MSYTPTEWATGDTITAEKLNKLEQGVAAGSLIVHVTATVDEGANLYSLVTPYSDILAAIEAGTIPLMMIEVEGMESTLYAAFIATDAEGLIIFSLGEGAYLSIDNTGSVAPD